MMVRVAAAAALLGVAVSARAAAPLDVRLPGGAHMAMVWVPAGTFVMGSPANEAGRRADEGPQTTVTLSHGFWISRTHVTIGQWRSVMGTLPRDQVVAALQDERQFELGGKRQTVRQFMGFSADRLDDYLANEDADLPMYLVSWEDARQFVRRLTAHERAFRRIAADEEYDLPTEAQWEYAARGGAGGARYGKLDDIAWYDANSAQGYGGKGFKVAHGAMGGPHAVAGKLPNNLGLYDVFGEVWQWCRDWYGPYPGGHVTDPSGPATGTLRVNRGGSFGSAAADERFASRAGNPPVELSAWRGFRVARVTVTRP